MWGKTWFQSCRAWYGRSWFSHLWVSSGASSKGWITWNLMPWAKSVEQVIPVIWMLMATFFAMKMGSGDYLSAVTQSTFAAFVGMVAVLQSWFTSLPKKVYLKSLWNGIRSIVSDFSRYHQGSHSFILTGSAIQLFQIFGPDDLYQ